MEPTYRRNYKRNPILQDHFKILNILKYTTIITEITSTKVKLDFLNVLNRTFFN